ncbi:DUF72 domain-containing protein [Paenibacillus pasadenensis]|uniref:DUF72 domain-containing protein n=1 Tax=Paenibacillus pasadenensis TaxID=217090 RepID=A0A2N5NDA9_9BACL|nr:MULTISPECIES: DUF72 domain-containing protein [Paenibacillus]PLT48336.1 hypothetical protein B8V81_0468 [Paenibacillus pasadenensis]QGG58178.1 DUF72 domain-containing protein [Paenibacillus sp. B01]
MITIGLAGWGDHDSLYRTREAAKAKLAAYSRLFGTVEVDSSFYAVQPQRNMEKWTAETPEDFRFVVKAYQGMTGHSRGAIPYPDEEAMFADFKLALTPMRESGKLSCVLFQYPPWFACTRESVETLRKAKRLMEDIPCALEFRHQSWFVPQMRERTLGFMREEGWRHSVCDEPQAGEGSIPIVEAATDESHTLVRMHGRHAEGWHSSGQPNWREVRYLYRYSRQELEEWAERLRRLEAQSRTVEVIFNNNSGGDAADNARELMALLGQTPPPIPEEPPERDPGVEQLELF